MNFAEEDDLDAVSKAKGDLVEKAKCYEQSLYNHHSWLAKKQHTLEPA